MGQKGTTRNGKINKRQLNGDLFQICKRIKKLTSLRWMHQQKMSEKAEVTAPILVDREDPDEKQNCTKLDQNEMAQCNSRVMNGLGMVSRGVPALVGCAIRGFPWEKSTEQRRQQLLDEYGGDLSKALHELSQEVNHHKYHAVRCRHTMNIYF